MRELLSGEVTRDAYACLLRNLHEIYFHLESGLNSRATHPGVAPIHLPALFRQTALEADLAELQGADWPQALPVHPAAHRYARHLSEISGSRPELLVAHAYVRYLGDLAGGQLLRQLVTRNLNLQAGNAIRFYDFGPPEQTAALARRFREGMQVISSAGAAIDEIVGEAKYGFALHISLFSEIAGTPPA